MVSTSNHHSKGGKSSGRDVKFSPGQDITDNGVIVDVKDQALHIFGRLPEGHTVSVFRVYDGDGDCPKDVPDIPVMCKDGCSPLQLFNVPNPECPTGRFIQNDIWLFYQGRYKLVYNSPDGDTVIPEDIYVWCKEDRLVSQLGINLPLCGENQCPPTCTPKHVMTLAGDVAPTADPNCLKCETPVAYNNDPTKPCEMSLYLWSKAPGSKCSDEGNWERINFAEWLSAMGGLITQVDLQVQNELDGSIDITPVDPANPCLGNKITLALAFNLACPSPTTDVTVATRAPDGEYVTSQQVWICKEGSPQIANIVFNCPDESGVIEIRPEGTEMVSEKAVWTCDANGNPIRSDLILKCPPTGTIIVLVDGVATDDWIWVCDSAGNIVKKKIIINLPVVVDECCDCYESEDYSAGGGACFQVQSSPTETLPVIFRGRDFSFIRGTGTNAFDSNGFGLKSVVISNSSDCPLAVKVRMSLLASRSLPVPDVGLSFIYMISETLAEPLPTDSVEANSPHDFNFDNIGIVPLGTLLNYDQPSLGEADNNNYSAIKSAPVYWKTVIPANSSKTFYAQWWGEFALQSGGTATTGVIFGHATMQISVEKNEGGVVINPHQL